MLTPCRTMALGMAAVVSAAALAQAPQKSAISSGEAAKVADTIVNRSAPLREGDLVLISGGGADQQLLEDVAVNVRKVGAFPLIVLESDRLTRKLYTEVPDRFDTQAPGFMSRLSEFIDATISIEYSQDLGLLADVPAKRIAARAKAAQGIEKSMLDRGVVSVHLGNGLYPSEDRAKEFGISYDELSKIFWSGVNTDVKKLQATAERVRDALAAGRVVKITAPNGTDLTLEIARRPVFASDGVITEEERNSGGAACQVWLPAGEVYLAPVPGTAQGTFVADSFSYEGKPIDGLTLKFEKGKLTSFTAKKDADLKLLRERYNAAPAGKELFGGLDLGINTSVKAPAGSRFVSWVAAGTISIGAGNNIWAQGDNDVPFGIYAHLPGGTLTVDGKPLIENGKLSEKK